VTREYARRRFERRVRRTDGCWTLKGGVSLFGYGRFSIDGKIEQAHRASFMLHMGPIPPGALVCHTCDNPRCVRPDHLFIGSHHDNMQDRMRKGRWKLGLQQLPLAM